MLRVFGLSLLAGMLGCAVLAFWSLYYGWNPLGRTWYYWTFLALIVFARIAMGIDVGRSRRLSKRDKGDWMLQTNWGVWGAFVPFLYLLRRGRRLNSAHQRAADGRMPPDPRDSEASLRPSASRSADRSRSRSES